MALTYVAVTGVVNSSIISHSTQEQTTASSWDTLNKIAGIYYCERTRGEKGERILSET